MEKQRKSFSRIIIILLWVLVALVLGVFLLIPKGQEEQTSAQKQTKSLIGGSFTLTNHLGEQVTDKTFAGKYMLIYFGYTYCPDVCPTELQIMSEAYDALDQDIKDKIQPLFISVDPERDTVDILSRYVPLFHKDLMGLTGTVEQAKAAKKTFRVYAAKVEDDSSSEYLMDHTSIIYLMDGEGGFVKHFSHGTEPEKMTAVLRQKVR